MKMPIRNKLVITCGSLTLIIIIAQIVFNMFFLNTYYLKIKEDGMMEAFLNIKENYNGTELSIEETVVYAEDSHNIMIMVFDYDGIVYITKDDFLRRTSSSLINKNDVYNLYSENINEFHKIREDIQRDNRDDREERIRGVGNTPNANHNPNINRNPNINPSPNPMAGIIGMLGDYKDIQFESQFSEEPEIYNIDSENRPTLRLLGKFDYEDNELFVSITLPVESIESSVDIFISTSAIISLVVFGASIILSIIVGNGLSKPIKEIEKITFDLSNLDFSNSINENLSTTELASLSKSINHMSLQLKNVISELNEANEKLQEDVDNQKKLEAMRREFVANVSHEMKTPLTLLQMYSENLKNNIDTVDKEYYCDTIIEETEYLNKMVRSMLDISAIESGIATLVYEKFSLTDLVYQLIDRMQLLIKDVELFVDIEDNIIVFGDANYLEQAMKNYITNALAHTDFNKKIEIKLYEEELVHFSVYNEGKKIDENEIDHIWESFYKSDKARVRNIEGNSGLGLNIVKTIVEKHDGFCYCENYLDGVVFLLELPKIKSDDIS